MKKQNDIRSPHRPAYQRSDPAALAKFDPATKQCTMNCGPANGDPRSDKERKFQCEDCATIPAPLVRYTTGVDPTTVGVYACRVPMDGPSRLLDDEFLLWSDGSWYYCGSDQQYRGQVLGWVGPLQRRMVP